MDTNALRSNHDLKNFNLLRSYIKVVLIGTVK